MERGGRPEHPTTTAERHNTFTLNLPVPRSDGHDRWLGVELGRPSGRRILTFRHIREHEKRAPEIVALGKWATEALPRDTATGQSNTHRQATVMFYSLLLSPHLAFAWSNLMIATR